MKKRYPQGGYHNCQVVVLLMGTILADEMLGIGDSYNDLPLFKASDYSFTFHSSPDSLKKEVNDVVSSVSEAINKVL